MPQKPPAAETYEKTLAIVKKQFQIRSIIWIKVKSIFLISVITGLSGCISMSGQFDKKDLLTYKVISPGKSHLRPAVIEGTYESAYTIFDGGKRYSNVIAIDDIKVGEYASLISSDWVKTMHNLEKAIPSYRTEVSPGRHSLLVLSGPYCNVSELDFTIEEGKKYLITSAIATVGSDNFIVDTLTKEKTQFEKSVNVDGGTLFKPFICEKLEEYRDNFIARHKKEK